MKKIILIIIASIMFANIGFAEIRLIEEKMLDSNWDKTVGYSIISTVCIDGYKFAILSGKSSRSIVQTISYADGSYPQRC